MDDAPFHRQLIIINTTNRKGPGIPLREAGNSTERSHGNQRTSDQAPIENAHTRKDILNQVRTTAIENPLILVGKRWTENPRV
jgi:hypothetical protein